MENGRLTGMGHHSTEAGETVSVQKPLWKKLFLPFCRSIWQGSTSAGVVSNAR